MEHSAQVLHCELRWSPGRECDGKQRGESSQGQGCCLQVRPTHIQCLLAACPHILPLPLSTIFLSLRRSQSLFILPTLNGFGKNYRHTKMLKSSFSSSLVSQTPQGTAHIQAQRCSSPGSSQAPAAPEKAGPGAVQRSTPGCGKAES